MKKQKTTDSITRREALRHGLIGAAGLALVKPLGLRAQSAPPNPKAKSVIQIWMWGGPCHLDTFDPKPEAGDDYCGPLKKPIPTNAEGIRIGENTGDVIKEYTGFRKILYFAYCFIQVHFCLLYAKRYTLK